MSGPKVVRIVTEEERLAIFNTEILRLNNSINSLFKNLERDGLLTEEIKNHFEEKLAFYKTEFSADDYQTIPNKIADEISFIESEKKRYKNIVLDRKAKEQIYRRNLSESIKTFELLNSRNILKLEEDYFPDPMLIFNLSESELKAVEKKVNNFLALASDKRSDFFQKGEYSSDQIEMIERLNIIAKKESSQKWKNEILDPQTERIDNLTAELSILNCDINLKQEFYKKVNHLYSLPSGSKKSLLIDSLTLDLARFIELTKKQITAKESLIDQQSILSSLGIDIEDQILRAIESNDLEVIYAMNKHCEVLIDQTIRKKSSYLGKKAITEELSNLGYSVNYAMQTALVENGKLVVKSDKQPDYGVEVREIPNTNKVQIRLVSHLPSDERRANDDIDAEEKWCHDFAKLQSKLLKLGIELDHEIALESGEQRVQYSQELKSIIDKDTSSTGKVEESRNL